MSAAENNKRIAKNTILLYIRMIFILLISLYTSRVVLSALGADDFGIYNVVGGVVVLFSFLTNAMTLSTQRFLNYNLGIGDKDKIKEVFNTAVLAHFIISLLILVLSETVGLWFLCTQLNIPPDRMDAALWVFHMSVFATIINVMVVPYRASIIASEKMSIFAYLSIVEAFLKLAIVLYLPYALSDKLIVYAVLVAVITFFIYSAYRYISRKKLYFTHYRFFWDKAQFKEQLSFSGWYLFGGVANVGTKQGISFFINIFFNVAVNAAVGISNQVRTAVYGFVSNFQTAFNPQIVKMYAAKQEESLIQLIYRSTKFSYYLMLALSLPVIVFCEEILSLWLKNVPEYTAEFTQLVILASFTEALSAPLWTAIGATGKIKKYQFFGSMIIILNIPLIYIFFKLGFNPISAFVINFIIDVMAYIYRLVYIKKFVAYSISDYFKKVLMPCLVVTVAAIPIPVLLKLYYNNSIMTDIFNIIVTFATVVVVIYLLGLDREEKDFMKTRLLSKFIRR